MPSTGQGQPVTGWTNATQKEYCEATEQPQLNVAWTCLGTGDLQSTAKQGIEVDIYNATQASATIQGCFKANEVKYKKIEEGSRVTINGTGVDAGNSMGGRLLIQETGNNWYLYTHEERRPKALAEVEESQIDQNIARLVRRAKNALSYHALSTAARNQREQDIAKILPTYSDIKAGAYEDIRPKKEKSKQSVKEEHKTSVSEIYTGFSSTAELNSNQTKLLQDLMYLQCFIDNTKKEKESVAPEASEQEAAIEQEQEQARAALNKYYQLTPTEQKRITGLSIITAAKDKAKAAIQKIRPTTTTKLDSLVLGAAGTRGFAYIGALEFFEDANIKFKKVHGSSAGAITALLHSDGVNSAFLKEYTKNESLQSLLARRKVTHSMSNPNSWNLPSMQYDMSYFMHEISLISYITKLHHLTSLSPEQKDDVAGLIKKLGDLIKDLFTSDVLIDNRITFIINTLTDTQVINKGTQKVIQDMHDTAVPRISLSDVKSSFFGPGEEKPSHITEAKKEIEMTPAHVATIAASFSGA